MHSILSNQTTNLYNKNYDFKKKVIEDIYPTHYILTCINSYYTQC